MLISDSAQPEPIASIRLSAPRASWITSSTAVLCVTWTPFHDCGPRSSRWIIVRSSVQRPGLRRRAAAAPTDPRRRPDAECEQGREHLQVVAPDPQLLDAHPLAVCEAAVGDGQVLAPQTPEEAVEVLRFPLGAGHVLRLGIAEPEVLVDVVGRRGRQKAGLAGRAVHFFTLPFTRLNTCRKCYCYRSLWRQSNRGQSKGAGDCLAPSGDGG